LKLSADHWAAGARETRLRSTAAPAGSFACPRIKEIRVENRNAKSGSAPDKTFVVPEDEVAYLAKRHRISPAIVREIMRRISSGERSAVEREIRKGMMRR